MALNTGSRATFSDSNAIKENVEDAITLVSALDVPLLKVIAGLQEAQDKPPRISSLPEPCTSVKYEWIFN